MVSVPGPYAKLVVNVKSGHDLRETAWVGKADPYAVIKVAGAEITTHHIRNAGENVTWDETFAFNNVALSDILEITVYDHNRMRKDDVIGSGTLPLREAFEEGHLETRVQLSSPGHKSAGEVWLTLKTEDLSTAAVAQTAGIGGEMKPMEFASEQRPTQAAAGEPVSSSEVESPPGVTEAVAEAPGAEAADPSVEPEEGVPETAAATH